MQYCLNAMLGFYLCKKKVINKLKTKQFEWKFNIGMGNSKAATVFHPVQAYFQHYGSLLMLQSLLSSKHLFTSSGLHQSITSDAWQDHSNDGFLLKMVLTKCSVSLHELSLIGPLLCNAQVSLKKSVLLCVWGKVLMNLNALYKCSVRLCILHCLEKTI